MKKENIRSVLLSCLAVASLSAYVFLSVVNVNTSSEESFKVEISEPVDNASELFLPDVELVKRFFEIGKTVFHPLQGR